MKKYISETRWEVEKAFGFHLSTQKLRRLEKRGLFSVERDGDFRSYEEDDIERIKMVVALDELGVEDEQIKEYMAGNNTVLRDRVDTLRKLENFLRGGEHKTEMPIQG